MAKEKTREQALADKILDEVNAFGLNEKDVAKEIANAHRTLQQNAMRLIMTILRALAENYDKGFYDARNEATVKMARKMVEAVEGEDGLPFI